MENEILKQHKEELQDLEQEVIDAQRAFDDDWYTLTQTMNHITLSYKRLGEYKNQLLEYKKTHNDK